MVFSTFWLRNVLRATTACTFSTSQLPKVLRDPGVFNILTSKCALRHNGVQFFISHLARWLRTRRPSGATNHWKNTVFRDFPTFSRICIFFLLTLSLLWSALFYSSLLSASSHLCFSSVHIVGSLTSKLPSIILHVFCSLRCKMLLGPPVSFNVIVGRLGTPSRSEATHKMWSSSIVRYYWCGQGSLHAWVSAKPSLRKWKGTCFFPISWLFLPPVVCFLNLRGTRSKLGSKCFKLQMVFL